MTILAKIASFFWSYLLELVIAILIGVAAWGGVMQWQRDAARREVQAEKDARAIDKAAATTAALVATNRYRALSDQLQQVKDEAQHAYDAAQTRNAAALAAASAGNDRLRSQLAAYAAGGGGAADDTVAAASERAATLGGLLAAALQSDAQHAADAESNGDAVRALLKAWPHGADAAPHAGAGMLAEVGP